jgi:hypothetical protein
MMSSTSDNFKDFFKDTTSSIIALVSATLFIVFYIILKASDINNKSGILNELRRAQGSVYDKNNSMAIGGSEFKVVQGDTTSISIPGKFYVGVNTQKLTESQDYMFTGISSANSQINVILSLGTTTTASMNAYLIANYDAIFEIDTLTKQLNYIQ